MGTSIVLCDYDPSWPERFEASSQSVCKALGLPSGGLEHIGSTAVPGIAAKPIIDLMLGVPDLSGALGQVRDPLARIGFQWMKAFLERFPNRLFFYRENSEGQRTEHLHVVERGSAEWFRHLAFRDFLRSHLEVAKEYEQLKRELVSKFDDTTLYSDAKTSWILQIEHRALREVSFDS